MKRAIKNIFAILLLVATMAASVYTTCDARVQLTKRAEESSEQQELNPTDVKDEENLDSIEVEQSKVDLPEVNWTDNFVVDMFKDSVLTTKYYIQFALEAIAFGLILGYLLMSGFSSRSFGETFRGFRTVLYIFLMVILASVYFVGEVGLSNAIIKANISRRDDPIVDPVEPDDPVDPTPVDPVNPDDPTPDVPQIPYSAEVVLDAQTGTLSDSYTTTSPDKSVILVKNGAELTMANATVAKNGGNNYQTAVYQEMGWNGALVVLKGSGATITNTNIRSRVASSDAVFVTGEDSLVHISSSNITTSGDKASRGLVVADGANIVADGVNVTTSGTGSAAVSIVGNNHGDLTLTNCDLTTEGTGSAALQVAGNVVMSNTIAYAEGSQAIILEGAHSITMSESTITCAATGSGVDEDQAAILIRRGSDTSDEGAKFVATGCDFEIMDDSNDYESAPLFAVQGINTVIELENNSAQFGSGVFLKVSADEDCGLESCGVQVILKAKEQQLSGDYEVDGLSTLTIQMEDSALIGTINLDDSAKEIHLVMDEASYLELTGDSYITSLTNADESGENIETNGYTLYINGVAYKK